jgi:hypothetical protein
VVEAYTWDYFDDGNRPPTLWELADELATQAGADGVSHIEHAMSPTIASRMECVSISFTGGKVNVPFLTDGHHQFIGMQGPAMIKLELTQKAGSNFNYVVDWDFNGQVFYQ